MTGEGPAKQGVKMGCSRKRVFRTSVAGAVLALLCQGTPAVAQAQTFELNIPAQDLGGALRAIARATRQEVAFESAAVRGRRAPALRGPYTAKGAVEAALAGSGLTVEIGRSGLLIVRPAAVAAAEPEAIELAEILVEGSRTLNIDVRRSEDDAQPYVVFDRDEISASQAVTVEEFLRTRMPQNAGFRGAQAQTTGNGRPFSSFDLRGLGSDETLILVNGRRLANLADQNFAPGQADVNGIPVGSIERIEVLPSSAGGIYGGNAVGGVINIILRRDYRGVEVTTTYNDTFDQAASSGRFDVNGGLALEGGRTTLTFGGSISRSDTLRVRDRIDLIQDGIDLGRLTVSPYAGTGFPPLGNGVNIRSANGTNLVLDPAYGGANLGSAVTHLPLGYAGVTSDLGALLGANAGTFDLDIPDTLSGLQRGLLTAPEMQSFNVGVRREFTSWIDGFVDFSRFENQGTTYSANQVPTTVTLAANAPTNPFQQQIRISFPSPGLAFPYESESTTETLAIGAIVRLPKRWALNLEVNRTATENSATFYQTVIDSFGTTCGLQASTSAACAGRPVLNPLQSPVDFGPYLFTEPTYLSGPYGSTFTNPSLRASGPLFRLPGGSASMTVALQQEATDIKRAFNTVVDPTTRGWLYVVFPGREQRTTSGYGEVVLPFLSARNNVPFVEDLELRLAVRYDDYLTRSPTAEAGAIQVTDPHADLPPFDRLESRFDSTNYTVAGRYSPVKSLILRASFATGFLPPNVVQLGSQRFVAPVGLGVADPQRGGEAINYPVELFGGSGNLQLRPEESESLSAGFVISAPQGFRLSADWTRIDKSDEIGGVPLDYLLANPDIFPGRVVRGDGLSGDPGGFAGRIISVDQSPINMLRSTYEAVDMQADYERDLGSWGRVRFYALATWQIQTTRQLVAGTPALDYSGNRDGPLQWQGNGGFDWEYGDWRVRWNTQVYDSYNIYSTQDPTTVGGAASIASAIALQGARKVPSQTYSDLHVSYEFAQTRGPLGGLKVSAGILNLFNETPPVIAITSYTQAGYSLYGDPRLRRFSVSVSRAF